MKPMNLTQLFFFSLFMHILTVHVAGDSSYYPVDDITLQCGSSETSIYDNRSWIGDINSKFPPTEVHQTAPNTTSFVRTAPPTITAPANRVPYTTARLSRAEFSYRFPVTAGQKFIRLYFNPVSYPDFDRSKSLFSVKAGGFTLLNNFNASVTADADAAADGDNTISREFCLNIEKEQSFNITFIPSTETPDAYAFINGIEIVSMPANLYYTAAQSDGPLFVGNYDNFFPIGNSSALEMMYRINIGGSPISEKDDTGMYRYWDGMEDEEKYLDDLSSIISVLRQNRTIQLKFSEIKEYSAPKLVYITGRSMVTSYNLTWGFPVDPYFSYLVRLHFCEFSSTNTRPRDRMFVIYIANQTAERGADIINWTGDKGNGIPIYKDYVVVVAGGSATQKKVNLTLFLALQAFQKHSMTVYNDVILNGVEIFKLNDSNGNLARPNRNPPLTRSGNPNKSRTPPMLAIVAGVVSGILLVLSVLGFLVFKGNGATKSTSTPEGSSLPPYLCRYFSLAEIKAATQNFNDTFIIGVGGFGNVYKGCIDGGATPVAIKRLKPESSQGAHEFKTEIELLSQLRHRHLVSLIGYSTDKGEMILVYDYMARGTLADHLYHSRNNPSLPWGQRILICIGAALGLQYLHGGAKCTIIHRDVKSTNILLDEKWVAKVSDFGLSKIGTATISKTHISTVVKGSFGYLDPEYYRRQRLTEKSDVYSFGLVLCEVLCGRPAVMHTVEETRQMNLAEWARSCHSEGKLDQIIDPSLRGKIGAECLNKFAEIAMSCMRDSGVERPSMNDIVRGLESALQLHQKTEDMINCNIVRKGETTKTSSSKQSAAINDSITLMSGTIFSEINDPSGR